MATDRRLVISHPLGVGKATLLSPLFERHRLFDSYGKSIDQVLDKQPPSHARAAVPRSFTWDDGGHDEDMAGGHAPTSSMATSRRRNASPSASQWSCCWWRSVEATTRLGVLDKALVVQSAPRSRLWW